MLHTHTHTLTDTDTHRDLIPGQVISKTQKMVLDASLLNTQHYKVRIKGKWNNLVKGVAPTFTTMCCSY